MKKLTVLLVVIIILTSCNRPTKADITENYKMYVWLKYDQGIKFSETKIYCDSIQMESVSSAYIWVDGTKQKIVAHRIRPVINMYYKKHR